MGPTPKQESDNVKVGHTYVQWLYAVLASTTLLTYGMQTGWISPMTKLLKSEDSPLGSPLSASQMSWVGSALPFTATCFVALYSYMADAYGRKFAVIAIAVPQALSWAIKLVATSPSMLIVARIVGGIPAGGCFNLVPMYVKEISQDEIRGTVVSLTLLMQNVGILAIYTMGSYLSYYTVLWIVICIPIVTVVLMIFAPDSPAFLVKKEKFEEAAKTVALLRVLKCDDKIVQNEMDHMKNEEIHYRSLPKIKFFDIFKNKPWRRGFLVITVMISAQGLNGNFAIMTYAWTIMTESGVTVNPNLQSLVVPSLMICGSFVSLVCVERIGRKVLLVSTYMFTTVAMLALATTQLLRAQGGSPPSCLPVVAIALSVFSYSAGITPMFYVIMSEIFNFQVRARLIGCIINYAWLLSSTQVAVFPPLSSAIGMYSMFFIFAAINLFGAIVVLVLIPETKGKSIEEIEKILAKK